MEKNTGKVREFCQSRKVGTMLIVIQIRELKFIELKYTGLLLQIQWWILSTDCGIKPSP